MYIVLRCGLIIIACVGVCRMCACFSVSPVGMLNGSASATSLLADKALGAAAATYQLALGTTVSMRSFFS